jgi:hypothetical protein
VKAWGEHLPLFGGQVDLESLVGANAPLFVVLAVSHDAGEVPAVGPAEDANREH